MTDVANRVMTMTGTVVEVTRTGVMAAMAAMADMARAVAGADRTVVFAHCAAGMISVMRASAGMTVIAYRAGAASADGTRAMAAI